ncbi:flagellar biosynthetic protein FliQ [Jatrophihabitans sp. GAS493]|uniref:flagellar biosynthetic protein FliQ n=1 Tax=Jatrophihabitans sp. GAS493 TaxID=1907575 RepID=UPI000BB6B760|nr:flagellar biosynthetic protein FliQ [Jatrophihabitans sp. GAS493]SOD71318.1 flagellar biosynthetic protein FliQ [Jatrophihabitans sp. GAS493]
MTDAAIVSLAMKVMIITAELAAPALVTSLLIGFAVSLFQSATQIQEFTLSFVPKALGVGVALLLSGRWMMHAMITFTHELFAQIPSLLH